MNKEPDRGRIRLSAETWEALFRAQVGVMRRLQKDPAFRQLSMREYDVLFNLTRCPTGWLRLNELNEHVLVSQPSLSRMVERLEARGLVQRRPAPGDQRGVLIGLTDRGREMQRNMGRAHVREIHRILGAALDEEELGELKALSEKLLRNLNRQPD